MEDRHYIKDPRPVPGLSLPTWDVDIYREGVDTPVLTLRVDNESLPPRRGKKKKIVWKLPDDVNQIPKFGLEDKKRIFELYKHEKKLRRLQRKNSLTTSNSNADDDTEEPTKTEVSENDPIQQEDPTKTEDPSGPPKPNGNKHAFGGGESGVETKVKSTAVLEPSSKNIQQPPAPAPAPPENGPPPVSVVPPGFQKLSISEKEEKTNGKAENEKQSIASNGTNTDTSQPPPPPPQTVVPSPRAAIVPSEPPGLSPPPNQQPPPPPPGITSPPIRNNTILVPPNSTLATAVTELYYGLLTRGLVADLLPYYTATAQKSLTVGGAHAVCGPTLAEKGLQLQHLVGLVVSIKGVLQQPTIGPGVLVLITGICIRPHALPFCHSLVLVPVENGFQIQNDALCFLTAEMTTPAAASTPEATAAATTEGATQT